MVWIERNDATFNDIRCLLAKLIQYIWLGLIDYGMVEWEAACKIRQQSLNRWEVARECFSVRWAQNEVLVVMINGEPRWALSRPRADFVFQPW